MGVCDQSKIGNAPSRGGSGGRVLKPPGYPPSTVGRGWAFHPHPCSASARIPSGYHLRANGGWPSHPPPCLLGFLARAVTGDPHLHPPPALQSNPACPRRILHLLDLKARVKRAVKATRGRRELGHN